MTQDNTQKLLDLEAGLTDLERELFYGTATGWGSWMFEVGSDLVTKGLGRKENGSIYFDTPLANELRARSPGSTS
jgi:hypothetical protein